jgi:hypothetical protein
MARPAKRYRVALIVAATALSGCITPEQVAQMPDKQVCESALAWPDGGPVYANYGYHRMFADEAVGRNLSVPRCADMLLEALKTVPDQDICGRSVTWSDLEQVPRWTNDAGIYGYVARSRAFQPIDCHDSNFECLDHGFHRGGDPFRQCRLQLIVARRENARVRMAIAATAAAVEQAEYEHHGRARVERHHDAKHRAKHRQAARSREPVQHTKTETKQNKTNAGPEEPASFSVAEFHNRLHEVHKEYARHTKRRQRKIDRLLNR